MRLLLPAQVAERLQRELRRGGRREIGGLLMGEHIEGETFRLVDITVQTSGGSFSHFMRDPAQHKPQLDAFFARTGQDYSRFNYLGEWHSHPSFEPLPSGTDLATMWSLVDDPAVGVNFLVLIIARIGRRKHIEVSATGFMRGGEDLQVDVSLEPGREPAQKRTLWQWLRGILS